MDLFLLCPVRVSEEAFDVEEEILHGLRVYINQITRSTHCVRDNKDPGIMNDCVRLTRPNVRHES